MELETKLKGSQLRKYESENTFKEKIRLEELLRAHWPLHWTWYVDLLRERQQAIADYKKCSPRALAMKAFDKPDCRSVLPFPETTSQNYGWLASKKEFQLEVFGKYYDDMSVMATSPDVYSSSDI